MKYIIGLGNPDPEYARTKHNVGFAVIKKIAKKGGIDINKALHSSLIGTGRVAGEDVTLVFPQTYMNLSGKAVAELVRRDVDSLDDIIVICDDINLKLGRIRLRKKGSAGGHRGLESIIAALDRNDFARLRVGIATDVHKGDITNYVLTPFKNRDRKHVLHVISLAREALIYWLKNGIEKTMTKFNTRNVGTS